MVCNKDCFNCPYPDCINDELTPMEYQEDTIRDLNLVSPTKNQKNYQRYRVNNLEKELDRDRERYEERKKRKKQTDKAWNERNKEYRQLYFRERYLRKKAERVS